MSVFLPHLAEFHDIMRLQPLWKAPSTPRNNLSSLATTPDESHFPEQVRPEVISQVHARNPFAVNVSRM
jgi:hypothetical protein